MHRCIPRHLPPLDFLLQELGYSPRQAAKVLHVTERTIHNWLKSSKEPYAPRLALFWLTSYGYNIIHTAAHNDACRFASLARCYKSRIEELEKKLLQEQKEHRRFSGIAANDKVFKKDDVLISYHLWQNEHLN